MAIDLTLVHASIRKTRNASLAVGLVTLAMGGGALALAIVGDSRRAVLAVIGGLFVAVALVTLRSVASMWRPARAPVARLVGERPADIRWIYVHELHSQVGGATMKKHSSIKIADAADRLHSVMVPNRDVEQLVADLRAAAPDALYGYTPEIRAAYQAQTRRAQA